MTPSQCQRAHVNYLHLHLHLHVCVDLLDAAWGVATCRIVVSFTRGCIALEFGLVSLCLHCFLTLSSAGVVVVLVPGCCWTHSALSM